MSNREVNLFTMGVYLIGAVMAVAASNWSAVFFALGAALANWRLSEANR